MCSSSNSTPPPPRRDDAGGRADPLGWPDAVGYASEQVAAAAGQIGAAAEDFQVWEEPAYAPAGHGEHTFCRLWKRNLTTREAVARLAQAVGVRPGDVGVAGQKDRRAVTEQTVSVPGISPARLLGLRWPDLEIRQAVPHPHKLRTGHLAGNRFRLRLVGTDQESAPRAEAVLSLLARWGLPNAYGPQRFGRRGATVNDGLRLLAGHGAARSRWQRRFLVSAVQSALFNAYLVLRWQAGDLHTPLPGEVLQRLGGGLFRCESPAAEAPRLAAGEVVATGPIFGPKMRPRPSGAPLAMEEAVLREADLSRERFQAMRRIAPGGRRPLLVWPKQVSVTVAEQGGVWLCFGLPPGAYATAVLREVLKRPYDTLREPPALDAGARGTS